MNWLPVSPRATRTLLAVFIAASALSGLLWLEVHARKWDKYALGVLSEAKYRPSGAASAPRSASAVNVATDRGDPIKPERQSRDAIRGRLLRALRSHDVSLVSLDMHPNDAASEGPGCQLGTVHARGTYISTRDVLLELQAGSGVSVTRVTWTSTDEGQTLDVVFAYSFEAGCPVDLNAAPVIPAASTVGSTIRVRGGGQEG